MAFEHHPGLHALWLANQKQPEENLVRTTEDDAAQAAEVDQQIEVKPRRRARRRKAAREQMDN